MINKAELEAAIAECQGKRNPDARTCIMLAAFYTIRRELFGTEEIEYPSYSYASAPIRNKIKYESDSEFAQAINGKDIDEILPIINELMETLNVMYPRLYNAVMMKFS